MSKVKVGKDKFEPQPAAIRPETAKVSPRSSMASPSMILGSPLPKKKKDDEDAKPGNFLDLGAGYKIRVNAGSGYCIFLSVMAKRCSFEDVSDLLDSKDFDPGDQGQASALLLKMMVPIADLEDLVRCDPGWQQHQKYRSNQVSRRAAGGHEATKRVIEKEERVKDGKWQGNIREMVSTCRGSYNTEAKNKNVDKFREAGVVFRIFPLKPKKNDKNVYAMLFPEAHVPKVKKAILSAYGIEE